MTRLGTVDAIRSLYSSHLWVSVYGIVTRNPAELDWPEFTRGFYEVKDVTGRRETPIERGVNMVSCHGDSKTSKNPAYVPVSQDGEVATRDQPYFDWGYVCPTHPDYRDELFGVIEDCAQVTDDVRLDDVGFPRPEYCYCDRCEELFAHSEYSDRDAWRETVITEFVAAASDRVPGRLFLTLYPDPYPGHLTKRSGIDVDALSSYVDEFVIPLYDMAYTTTYWLEVIASGFQDALSIPFSIELYAVNVETANLAHATEVVTEYAADVYFAYDADTARAVINHVNSDP